ncbi:hypothetical protein LJB90_01860 [Eubacteriales bacterium OttesenSCG-928-G02]|nr:hypothetical protein [Eubacteriales bacterium OttesenSCG-928-G02]
MITNDNLDSKVFSLSVTANNAKVLSDLIAELYYGKSPEAAVIDITKNVRCGTIKNQYEKAEALQYILFDHVLELNKGLQELAQAEIYCHDSNIKERSA